MKKLFCFILIIPFLLTGCEEKEFDYTCRSYSEEEKVNEEVIGHFKSDKLQSTVTSVTIDLTDYLQYESIDSLYDKFVQKYEDFKGQEGIEVEIEKGDTFVKVKLFIDFNSITDEVYNNLGIKSDDATIYSSTFIKSYTDEGYTCE